jgi:glycosyltransferase involved in cell wall biosynthesis
VRVLTFTSLFPNSQQPLLGIFVYQRIAHFARRPGNLVQVVAPVPYFPRWLPGTRWQNYAQIPREERIGNLTVYHPRYLLLPKISMPLHGLLMFLGSLSLVRRLKQKIDFDCIDAHYVYPDGFAATMLGRRLGLPVIVSARGTDVNLFPSFPLIRSMIRRTLRRAAGIVAVSKALKENMVKLGVPPEKISVIGNGVDTQRFQPLDRQMARRQLGMPEEAQVVVSVGSLIPSKGYQLLLAAAAGIAPRHPNLQIYLLGEGFYRARLEALAHEAGMQDRLHLVGSKPNEELAVWFSAADVSCLASAREGWPNVLLESLACGTPVLATRVGGVPEVITSSELGVLVDQDVASIARGLEQALERQWDREALVRYAQTRTWDVVAAEVERYLASQIPSRGSSAAR